MRSITKFRTTLGHKTNCAFFEEQNTEFGTVRKKNGSIQIMEKDIISSEDNGAQVRHPVLGPIVILVASKPIAKEEEVTAKKI